MRYIALLIAVIQCVAYVSCSKKVVKSEVQSTILKDTAVTTARTMEPPPVKKVDIRDILQPVYFDFNKSNLRSDAIAVLEKIAPVLLNTSDVSVLIEGHCDERGTSQYNMGLGENRARAVKQYFVSYGIPERRIDITSYGKEKPAHPNCMDEDCHEKNRRIEWVVRPENAGGNG